MPTGHYDRSHLRTDLVGKTIGYAYVRRLAYRTTQNFWECECLYNNCGNIFVKSQASLMNHKEDANCGCLSKEKGSKANKKFWDRENNIRNLPYGLRIYEIHHGMTQRCNNPNHVSYSDYGGRGIKVCREWEKDRKAFYDWAIANGYSDELSIDRIDPNGDYCPDNCRWSDAITQSNNQRDTVKYEYQGCFYTVAELARKVDINEGTLLKRLDRGLSIEDACKKVNEQNGHKIKGYSKRKR